MKEELMQMESPFFSLFSLFWRFVSIWATFLSPSS